MMRNKLLVGLKGMAMFAIAADVPAADKNAKPSDSEKLKIRDLQVPSLKVAGQMASLESQWKELAVAFQKYKSAEDQAVAELGKKLGCDIDPQTVECKPKAAAAKPAEPAKPPAK